LADEIDALRMIFIVNKRAMFEIVVTEAGLRRSSTGLAQQHSQAGNYQVYWRVKAVPVGSKSRRHEAQMDGYLLATKAAQLFPS
jgi:hypothetical protein